MIVLAVRKLFKFFGGKIKAGSIAAFKDYADGDRGAFENRANNAVNLAAGVFFFAMALQFFRVVVVDNGKQFF